MLTQPLMEKLLAMRYLRLLHGTSGNGGSGDGLVAVELAGKQLGGERAASCGVAVVLGKGRRIAVSSGFDATTLRRVVQVLETT